MIVSVTTFQLAPKVLAFPSTSTFYSILEPSCIQ